MTLEQAAELLRQHHGGDHEGCGPVAQHGGSGDGTFVCECGLVFSPFGYTNAYGARIGIETRENAEWRDKVATLNDGSTCVSNRLVVPLILHCPECNKRHVDKGDFAKKPHHTHACQSCGFTWRPAVVNTVGVQFLPGFKDAKEQRP